MSYDGPVLLGNFKGIDVGATNIPGLYDLRCTECGTTVSDATTGQTRSFLGSHPETCLPIMIRESRLGVKDGTDAT